MVDTIKQWSRIEGIEIIEGQVLPDHGHLCVSAPPNYSVANVIALLAWKERLRGNEFWDQKQQDGEGAPILGTGGNEAPLSCGVRFTVPTTYSVRVIDHRVLALGSYTQISMLTVAT